MSVYMPKINYILLIYRNLFLTPIHASKLLLLNSLMEFLGTNTDIHLKLLNILLFRYDAYNNPYPSSFTNVVIQTISYE
ncbi:hypothetical protein CLI85_07770 [Tannerella forsythia]|nr:hypothetical protein CLI85_07770 [Tannerella forsythia]